MTRPQKRILPLLILLACADARAQDDSLQWVLCSQNPLFEFYRGDLGGAADRETRPAEVQAGSFDISGSDEYVLSDGAEIIRADQRIAADELRYRHQASSFLASGNVQYQDSGLLLGADRAEGDLAADRTTLEGVRYQLLDARGNGSAGRATMIGSRSRLESVSFSTCDPDNRGWELRARRMDLDSDTGVGTARGATLRLGNVPLLYLPYVNFPIDDRRKSGFLYPGLGYSGRDGIELQVPYYLNLAPNYDATLTPRILGRRGVQLGAEFRYLGRNHSGYIEGDYLPDDNLAERDRGSLSWRHVGRLGDRWLLRGNVNHVSDDSYFEDFGDSLSGISTTLLESEVGIHGRGMYWNAAFTVEDYDLVDPEISDRFQPFQRLPRAVLDYRRPLQDWLHAGVRAEAVNFGHDERDAGSRYDVHPYLAAPIEAAWGFLRPEIGFRHTGYQLDRGFEATLPDRSPTRGTPIFSVDGGLIFERSVFAFGENMLQTLEPRLYYLRVPYREQDDLPLFDTQELTFSFAQLFRNNRFTGADRQMDANQATLAISTRLFSENSGRERLSASIGQIRYFDDQRVQLSPLDAPTEFSGSPYVADVGVSLSDDWSMGGSLQWDPEDEETRLGSIRSQLRWGNQGLLNVSYRFRRTTAEPVEQIDTSVLYPLAERWRLIGRWNYSLVDAATLEALAGVQWESCCIAVRTLARHFVRNRSGEKDNALYVEIELKGLGAFGRNADDILERGILGYRQL